MKIVRIFKMLLVCGFLASNLMAQERKTELIVQTGHTGKINSITISKDGKLAATASRDNSIKIWSLQTGLELMTLVGHTSEVYSAAFSPNGEKIVSGAGDGIKLWETKTGKMLENLSGFPTLTVSFSPDGRRIAAGDDETAKVWNLSNLKNPIVLKHCIDQGRLIESQTNAIYSVIFDADSNGLYTQGSCIGNNSPPVYWNISGNPPDENFACQYTSPMPFENGYFYGIYQNCLEEKLKILFKGQAWADVNEKIRSNYPNYQPEFAIASDGKTVLTATDANLKFWDAKTGENLHDKNQFANSVATIALSPDSRFLAVKGNGNFIKLYDLSKGSEPKNLNGHQEAIRSIAFDYENKTLVSRSENEYKIWDVATGKSIVPPTDKKMLPFEIKPTTAISPDGKLFASADAGIYIFDVATRNSAEVYGGYPGEVYAVALSKPEGNNYYLAVISYIGYKGTTLDEYLVTSYDGNIATFGSSGQGEPVGDFRQKVRPQWLKKYLDKYPDLDKKWKHFINEPETEDGKFKFKITGSGKVTVFDAKTDAELCSLMTFGANDWAVVTPDGLFDGTAQAWKQMRWRLDADISNLVPVEAFFNEFYYPGLMEEILQGKNPKPLKKDLSQVDIRQSKVKITEIDGQPTNSPNSPSTDKRTVTVKVEISDNADKPRQTTFPKSSGAKDLRLFRNGSLVKLWENDVFKLGANDGCKQIAATANSPRKAVCQADLTIIAGDNEFSAYAFNQDNVKSGDATATVKGANALKRQGVMYVLAVGVNEYAADSGLDEKEKRLKLRFAVADVEAIGKEIDLRQNAQPNKQYARTEIVTLTDRQATKANILKALRQFASGNAETLPAELKTEFDKIKKTEPEDALIIYFAGHGVAGGDRFYLVPHDGAPAALIPFLKNVEEERQLTHTKTDIDSIFEQLFRQSISDVELEAILTGLDVGKLMMVIDACNSGQALDTSEEKRRGPMNSKGLAQLAYEKGMYILTASQNRQAALETTKLGHGLLTFSLLQGMQKADGNGDKNITDREWFDFAVTTVPQLQIEIQRERLLTMNKKETDKPSEQTPLQTPRVFYRREMDSKPLIIALSR